MHRGLDAASDDVVFTFERAPNLPNSPGAFGGFPQGFRLTLVTPNDRYPNDARTAQAVARMWTRFGIRTEVQAPPWAFFSARATRRGFACQARMDEGTRAMATRPAP